MAVVSSGVNAFSVDVEVAALSSLSVGNVCPEDFTRLKGNGACLNGWSEFVEHETRAREEQYQAVRNIPLYVSDQKSFCTILRGTGSIYTCERLKD